MFQSIHPTITIKLLSKILFSLKLEKKALFPVITTLIIGLVVWAAGVAFATRFGHAVDAAASIALVAFGGWIAVSALRELRGGHGHGHGLFGGHHHHHGEQDHQDHPHTSGGIHGPELQRICVPGRLGFGWRRSSWIATSRKSGLGKATNGRSSARGGVRLTDDDGAGHAGDQPRAGGHVVERDAYRHALR
jgi:hypothetical protein